MDKNDVIIGISATRGKSAVMLNNTYLDAVIAAGGTPVLLPEGDMSENTEKLLSFVDGLLIPGGPDVNPLLYNEEPLPLLTGPVNARNDVFEISLIRSACRLNKPILGICRGQQIINVAFGGTLVQDIRTQIRDSIGHSQLGTESGERMHSVFLEPSGTLWSLYGTEHILTNSLHHQAVKSVADGFYVTARTADGCIEGIESNNRRILCMQWHPEDMYKDDFNHLQPFIWLIREAKKTQI